MMDIKALRIAGYCRISVDDELDRDNTSIENQKAIIKDYVSKTFPDAFLEIYEDRDRSGYTFEQREDYQRLRRKMMAREYDILIIKDFSRFSRRNSKGLVELEDLRDAGMRIISIGDGIDYPTYDDWTAIQFRFLINEMPVTDTSKKVKSVIKRRQEEGKWICAVPYGYIMTDSKKMKFEVDEPAAEVVREIFQLYSDGWGYKRIANFLTEQHIPTPRASEKARKEIDGEKCKLKASKEWSIITVSEILKNDFYIGTLRQRKYHRIKINGKNTKLEESDNLVFENNHAPIVDFKLFAGVQEQMKKRSKSSYRGIKKYDNIYSGYLYCGDCGSPMFSMSRVDIPAAYRCGEYHKHGLRSCTSHHIRVDVLDGLLRAFIIKVRDNSADMLSELQKSIDKERNETSSSKSIVKALEQQIEDARSEIKLLARQHIKDVARRPEREKLLEEIYNEQVDELTLRIEGLRNQMQLASNKHNMIANLNRVSKTVMEVFDNIVYKDKLTRADVDFIIEKIKVYEDHIDVELRPDIDMLLKKGELPKQKEELTANFNCGTEEIYTSRFAEVKTNRGGILSVNIISDGAPLEIYTGADGEIVLKKYSAVNEMGEADSAAEIMYKLSGSPSLVFDRDNVVAAAGVSKKEYIGRRVSMELEDLMQRKASFFTKNGGELAPVEGIPKQAVAAIPVISSGDVTGAAVILGDLNGHSPNDTEAVAKAAAMFLGKQTEID